MLLRARDRNRTKPLESFWPGQQLGAGSRGLRGGKGRRSSGRAVKNRLSALPQLSNSGRSWRNFNAVFRRPACLIVGRSTWPYTHAYIYEPLIRLPLLSPPLNASSSARAIRICIMRQ